VKAMIPKKTKVFVLLRGVKKHMKSKKRLPNVPAMIRKAE